MATVIEEVTKDVEHTDEGSGDLANDLINLQDAIHEQKASLSGVPEGLRKEVSELRAQLSCVSLLDRLEGLKDSLASAATGDNGETNEQCGSGALNAMDALYAAEKMEADSDLEDMLSALNDAKEFAAKLETDKMRLQKEMMELQLLMQADCGAEPAAGRGSLPCDLSLGQESDVGSPRISALPEEGSIGMEHTS